MQFKNEQKTIAQYFKNLYEKDQQDGSASKGSHLPYKPDNLSLIPETQLMKR